MEENFSRMTCKDGWVGGNNEADCRERRLVFVDEGEPAGGGDDTEVSAETPEAPEADDDGTADMAKKQDDGINFILDKL